jgi:hypothetical protein
LIFGVECPKRNQQEALGRTEIDQCDVDDLALLERMYTCGSFGWGVYCADETKHHHKTIC